MGEGSSRSGPSGSATPPGNGNGWGWLNPAKWLEVIGGVVKDALARAPRDQAGVIAIAFLVTAIAIVGGIALIYKGDAYIGGAIIAIAIVVLVVAMVRISLRVAQPGAAPVHNGPEGKKEPDWSRVTVKVPLTSSELNDLSDHLRTILTVARKEYSNLIRKRGSPSITADEHRVRANVFLPDTRDVGDGEVCGLFIPKGLHHGMTNQLERGIRFRPDEGVTGRVFSKQRPIGTCRISQAANWEWIHLEGSGGTGDEGFELTQVQKQLVDPELRWIVSFPLKVRTCGEDHTVGVLNVDGLTELLSSDELRMLYQALTSDVRQFAQRLGALNKCKITLAVEDVPNGPVGQKG